MKVILKRLLLIAVYLTSSLVNASNEIPAETLFVNPNILNMSLSPNGKYVLELGQTNDTIVVNLIDTKTFKKYQISPDSMSKALSISNFTWLDDTTLYIQHKKKGIFATASEKNTSHIVKINDSVSPLKVAWHKITVDGYLVSKKINENGKIIFAKTDGEFNEYYRLYQTTVDELLAGNLNFFKKHRVNLSNSRSFYLDSRTNILVGYTTEEQQVKTWYLSPDETFWAPLYNHGIKDKFKPLYFLNKNTLVALTNKGADYSYVAEFDIKKQTFTKTLYKHPSHDITSAAITKQGKLHSVSYVQHGVTNTEYFSSETSTIQDDISNIINAQRITLIGQSKDGNIHLALASASNSPGTMHLFNRQSKKLSNLGSLRKNLENHTLAKAEVFNVKVNEQLTIEGIVTKPSGQSNGVLLVNPHGGPIGVRDYANFNLTHQFYASRGYTILNVNFRGSSGFGKSFENQGRGQFGKIIEQDIMHVYQHFIKDNAFDYTCSMGSSYGGYSAVMLAIKHPEHFQCAISVFGVFDLPHLYNATNSRQKPAYRKALKNVMGDDMLNLKNISPITLANKLNVPVFLLAGRNDSIAPFEQSNRMKYILKKLGKSFAFHTYENTGHGHKNWSGVNHQHNAIDYFIKANRNNLNSIIESFKNTNIKEIKKRLLTISDINSVDQKGYSLLHRAIEIADEQFSLQVITLLLKSGISIDIRDETGQTPLYLAVANNKQQLVKLLLSKGADVNTQTEGGWTPIFLAASNGSLEIAKELLKYEIDFSYIHSEGWTALMFTTNKNDKASPKQQALIAQLLIKKGEDIEHRNKNGLTVLMTAALNGKLDVVKLLIESGADATAINNKYSRRNTAFKYAEKAKHTAIVNYLKPITQRSQKNNKAVFNSIIDKLNNNDIEEAINIIPSLKLINFYDKKGRTLAHHALKLKNNNDTISVLSTLIENNANISFRNRKKRSPLYEAVVLKRTEIVKFLLKNGARLNQPGPNKWTPLFRAISQGNTEMVREMSKYPLNLHYRTEQGWTALMFITNDKHIDVDEAQSEIGRLLINKGADIEVRTNSGLTPLMNAVSNGKINVVKMLINVGADINATNPIQYDKTPLDYAIDDDRTEIVNYLRKIKALKQQKAL